MELQIKKTLVRAKRENVVVTVVLLLCYNSHSDLLSKSKRHCIMNLRCLSGTRVCVICGLQEPFWSKKIIFGTVLKSKINAEWKSGNELALVSLFHSIIYDSINLVIQCLLAKKSVRRVRWKGILIKNIAGRIIHHVGTRILYILSA